MIDWFLVVLGIIGILLIFVYPKIIRYFLFGLIIYLTIFNNWLWSIGAIVLLIIMLIMRRKGERDGNH